MTVLMSAPRRFGRPPKLRPVRTIVMTRADPLLRPPPQPRRQGMIRPDYRHPSNVHVLPGSLRLISTFPFVGRSAELATLRALLPRSDGAGGRVALVGGEP